MKRSELYSIELLAIDPNESELTFLLPGGHNEALTIIEGVLVVDTNKLVQEQDLDIVIRVEK